MMKGLLKLLALSMLLISCAHAPVADEDYNPDKFESYNRFMHGVNQGIDAIIFNPFSTVYNDYVPWPIRRGVTNFYANLNTIPTIANDLLQAKFYYFVHDTGRLVINSTLGLLGLIDVASHFGMEKHEEDLGLTFARWGWKRSSYVVAPIFGPYTVRDSLAALIQLRFLTVYGYLKPIPLRNKLLIGNILERQADANNAKKIVDETALDPYSLQKDAYLQHRQSLIDQDKPETEDDDPFIEADEPTTEKPKS